MSFSFSRGPIGRQGPHDFIRQQQIRGLPSRVVLDLMGTVVKARRSPCRISAWGQGSCSLAHNRFRPLLGRFQGLAQRPRLPPAKQLLSLSFYKEQQNPNAITGPSVPQLNGFYAHVRSPCPMPEGAIARPAIVNVSQRPDSVAVFIVQPAERPAARPPSLIDRQVLALCVRDSTRSSTARASLTDDGWRRRPRSFCKVVDFGLGRPFLILSAHGKKGRDREANMGLARHFQWACKKRKPRGQSWGAVEAARQHVRRITMGPARPLGAYTRRSRGFGGQPRETRGGRDIPGARPAGTAGLRAVWAISSRASAGGKRA